MTTLALADIDRICGGYRAGTFDVACPFCGPRKRHALNRRRKVMRVWRPAPHFATWFCARCGAQGHTRDPDAAKIDKAKLDRIKREAREREMAAHKQRLDIAQFLWGRRRPLEGSPGERYLRETRGYHGRIPATLGFLPARGTHGPAMIAAFGIPDEPDPGNLSIRKSMVMGVHVTRLSADGARKAGTDKDKIMIGHSTGSPIVLGPINDLLGLGIVEGIESGLSLFESTGLGVWVAGAASRMPALANAVPGYADCVTICADDDVDGRRHAMALRDSLQQRKLFAEVVFLR